MTNEELAVKAQAGDQEAMEALLKANAGLICSVACRYKRMLPWDDLLQHCRIALVNVVRTFDASRGFRLCSTAKVAMGRECVRALQHRSVIHIPSYIDVLYRQMLTEIKATEREEGRTPALPELARRLGITTRKAEEVWAVCAEPVLSLDHILPAGDDGARLVEFLEGGGEDPAARFGGTEEAAEALVALKRLSRPYRRVLLWRYGLTDGIPRTLEEIAALTGVTREAVRQQEVKALKQLRFLLGHPERSNTNGNHGDD